MLKVSKLFPISSDKGNFVAMLRKNSPKYLVFSLLLFSSQVSHSQKLTYLFPIDEDNRFGYVDHRGNIIIKAKYHVGGEFSEGVAPVREEGLYGFINDKGAYVIPPQFEYAQPFQNGYAIVYSKGGKPSFITRDGKEAFQTNFKELNNFSRGRAEVVTYSSKHGFIDTLGTLIIDTLFKEIHSFEEGRAVVMGMNHYTQDSSKRFLYEVGVIDTLGYFIVPFGRYTEIRDYEGGLAYVDVEGEKGDLTGKTAFGGFIDREGKVSFMRSRGDHSWIQGDFSSGLACISLYKHWLREREGVMYASNKSYEGYINTKGEVVLNDTTVILVKEFTEGRGFISQAGKGHYLIDSTLRIISQNSFTSVGAGGFRNGLAFAEKDFRWGIINKDGEWVVSPKFREVNDYSLFDRYFYFIEQVKDIKGQYQTRQGVADYDGRVIVQPNYLEFDERGFVGDLLQANLDGRIVYLDTTGRVVWQSRLKKQTTLTGLNIDYINRGYGYVFPGGLSREYNRQLLTNHQNKHAAPSKAVAILATIDTTKTIPFLEKYKGMKLTIKNVAGRTITFPSQDHRIDVKLQALDTDGLWKDIEYLPSSWCGNSYGPLDLKAKGKWELSMPVYEGVIATKVRAEICIFDPNDKNLNEYKRKKTFVYSNEVRMSINPGQFWRKPEYKSGGLMDPYNE